MSNLDFEMVECESSGRSVSISSSSSSSAPIGEVVEAWAGEVKPTETPGGRKNGVALFHALRKMSARGTEMVFCNTRESFPLGGSRPLVGPFWGRLCGFNDLACLKGLQSKCYHTENVLGKHVF